jgi:hypothetical protein
MFGLDTESGAMRFSFSSGSSVAVGPAIANGVVDWGSPVFSADGQREDLCLHLNRGVN